MQNDYSYYTNSPKTNVISVCSGTIWSCNGTVKFTVSLSCDLFEPHLLSKRIRKSSNIKQINIKIRYTRELRFDTNFQVKILRLLHTPCVCIPVLRPVGIFVRGSRFAGSRGSLSWFVVFR